MSTAMLTHEEVSLARAEKPSRLSHDLVVEGNIDTVGTVIIDGTVHGDIFGATVCIDENGNVAGFIRGTVVAIGGTHTGDVECISLSLTSSGCLIGTATYEKIEVESGAVLTGRLLKNHAESSAPLDDGRAFERGY